MKLCFEERPSFPKAGMWFYFTSFLKGENPSSKSIPLYTMEMRPCLIKVPGFSIIYYLFREEINLKGKGKLSAFFQEWPEKDKP